MIQGLRSFQFKCHKSYHFQNFNFLHQFKIRKQIKILLKMRHLFVHIKIVHTVAKLP